MRVGSATAGSYLHSTPCDAIHHANRTRPRGLRPGSITKKAIAASGARPHRAADHARPRRRGDRMKRLTSALIPFLFLALTAHNVRMHPADWPQGYAKADQISATSTIASA